MHSIIRSVCRMGGPRGIRVAASHRWALPSLHPVAIILPLGLKASDHTSAWCERDPTHPQGFQEGRRLSLALPAPAGTVDAGHPGDSRVTAITTGENS
jgi:hypothetical protein